MKTVAVWAYGCGKAFVGRLGSISRRLYLGTIWRAFATASGIGTIAIGLIIGATNIRQRPAEPAPMAPQHRPVAQVDPCTFGQIEDMANRACVWTPKWDAAGADELTSEAAKARLNRVVTHLQSGKIEAALPQLEPLLLAGNPEAQRIAALMYLRGDGVPVDEAKANHLLTLAAEQNDPTAKFLLADKMTEDCEETCPQMARALPLFEEASAAGVDEATEALARIYSMGIGVPRDIEKAVPFVKAAAEAGLVESQRVLAEMFLDGDHVPQSDELALKWFLQAARQGDVRSLEASGVMFLTGRGTERDADYGFSLLWIGAIHGVENAQFLVGMTLYEGALGTTDKLQGLMWLKLASRNGSKKASAKLRELNAKLDQTQQMLSDLMADDCQHQKRCGTPPWKSEHDAEVDPTPFVSGQT